MSETDDIFRQLAERGVTPEQAAAGVKQAKRKTPTRDDILNVVLDAVGSRMLFYSRKESELVPVFAIEDAIIAGTVTIEELVDVMRTQLTSAVENRRGNPGDTYP